jgi:two-component system phosphate regulon sensor histidine kinase PhoR
MRRKNLRRVILFGSVVMMGLLIVQGFWMKRAFDIEERQFNHTVQIALKNIADSIVSSQNSIKPAETHVRQLSSNFFFAELNTPINPELLDSLLKKELGIRQLKAAYELGIYKSKDDTLVYGEYIPATIQWQIDHARDSNPIHAAEKSNFAIYFPNKFSVIAGELKIWIFSTVVLLLMLAFFIYAILTMLRERRLAEIKEDFINNLTHEFKTPISNIELASEALKTNKIDIAKQSRYHTIIHNENQRLKSQVERVLQMGTVDKNELRLDLKLVNIHDLIQKLSQNVGMRVNEKVGTFKVELNAVHAELLADEFHLTNTVYNVLDNAEKYSKDKPEISISTKNEKGGLLISIKDTGIGIKQDFQKFVFDKFFRVPTGDVHNVKGFGLGLSYVKTIIEAHKGTVTLESKLNQGSQFDIYLPFR